MVIDKLYVFKYLIFVTISVLTKCADGLGKLLGYERVCFVFIELHTNYLLVTKAMADDIEKSIQ